MKNLKPILFFRERLPFTSAYFGSLFATLYFAMSLQSTILTTVAASVQVLSNLSLFLSSSLLIPAFNFDEMRVDIWSISFRNFLVVLLVFDAVSRAGILMTLFLCVIWSAMQKFGIGDLFGLFSIADKFTCPLGMSVVWERISCKILRGEREWICLILNT